ncbi:MAG: hypothetical protein KDD53_06605 [Bdellovibrionales bacterium]|nr:hypothetical protein [Bdellovibrionales bacterium]
MDWLTFISNLADSLAWPAAVVLIVFSLRSRIEELIPYLRRLKYKDLELEFAEKLESIAVEVQESLPQVGAPTVIQGPSPETARYKELARLSPSAAVVEGWKELELSMVKLLTRHNQVDESQKNRPPGRLVANLDRIPDVSPSLIRAIDRIRRLRNAAVHEYDESISTEQAEKFALVAVEIARRLDKI